jgi:GxxExxY protein
MHPLYVEADTLSGTVIGAAMEVHRTIGAGLLESLYERCLLHELSLREHRVENQKLVHVRYKDLTFDEALRFDVLVDDCLLVETKAVEHVLPITRPNFSVI